MLATSLADIGARLLNFHSWFLIVVTAACPESPPALSFLSCLAYGKQGITAVTREAEAILQALIIINSSMRLSLTSPLPL
uniref:Putative secreted protein n=1 Tax=Panstrongylus lignarius TaxID=156445 RepID=A0A224Y4L8_9HEMI